MPNGTHTESFLPHGWPTCDRSSLRTRGAISTQVDSSAGCVRPLRSREQAQATEETAEKQVRAAHPPERERAVKFRKPPLLLNLQGSGARKGFATARQQGGYARLRRERFQRPCGLERINRIHRLGRLDELQRRQNLDGGNDWGTLEKSTDCSDCVETCHQAETINLTGAGVKITATGQERPVAA